MERVSNLKNQNESYIQSHHSQSGSIYRPVDTSSSLLRDLQLAVNATENEIIFDDRQPKNEDKIFSLPFFEKKKK